jgi:hypothetical protein
MSNWKSVYFEWRERIRLNPRVSEAIYFCQSLRYSNFGDFRRSVALRGKNINNYPKGVALCCRIRDEALYLRELVEYYVAAGVDHFFFYEKLSQDNYRDVIAPYVKSGLASLFDQWPHVPVSPAAEEDCLLRAIGQFEWVGFIDADEFVVVRDGRSIAEFLADYRQHPAVALHWHVFGSNGHKQRPSGPVIAEYTRRRAVPDFHVKCFVRPAYASNYRNSHSWYYQRMRTAVTELGKKVRGSISIPASAERAWINHYYHKSEQDYLEKAARKSVLDRVGIAFPTRTRERSADSELTTNEVEDDCAVRYYLERCRRLGKSPSLLNSCKPLHEDSSRYSHLSLCSDASPTLQ